MATDTVIVMGGSFNPPTRAHLSLMMAAADEMRKRTGGNVRGVFVPSGEAYLMKKRDSGAGDHEEMILPEELRLAMLETFSRYGRGLSADGRELGSDTVRGHTLITLRSIQCENPGARILFILGEDKLPGFSGWKFFRELVTEFGFIVFRRDGTGARLAFGSDPELKEHEDSFIILDQPADASGISSGRVRRGVSRGDDVSSMLTPEVSGLLSAWLSGR
ncbi:MAG: hypothetical protein IJU57_05320 [Clostridia bacterium]|nr:hypothetical protein [Clostridia bacterium]